MSRGFPSMTALLGLLAVAGFQNRDKIAEFLNGLGNSKPAGGPEGPAAQGAQGTAAGQGGLGDIFEKFRDMVSGAGTSAGGAGVTGGLSELLERFRQNGQGETAESWVKSGPNKSIEPSQLEQAIGPDVLDALVERTGLSRQELLARLANGLPEAIDKYTPDGRLPAGG
ncbi:YidB family protein [Chelatococcus reniformis]|uniref:DUF937 domain-containing protein n=1 Tax=Chelatococcus reniformis TaxID=1494448 RepID=A0A916UXZ1_9HYPH|nr:YidB family protein [Chelatococcus reniformis]GGC93296.1 hypothetical protein GCM10010994_58890 [Chelatococcus reniformis]